MAHRDAPGDVTAASVREVTCRLPDSDRSRSPGRWNALEPATLIRRRDAGCEYGDFGNKTSGDSRELALALELEAGSMSCARCLIAPAEQTPTRFLYSRVHSGRPTAVVITSGWTADPR